MNNSNNVVDLAANLSAIWNTRARRSGCTPLIVDCRNSEMVRRLDAAARREREAVRAFRRANTPKGGFMALFL